ncbi:NAD(P)-dependent oxidoreductase [Methylocapsa sp. S129]|uniref:NAD-dependent epimerase/dehydratase family protein n=1 Tax=Methylocapsa sp. S129 TaxID=1641869 RepID=UPI00131C5006|nr:SDR family oxidoreductase [Methylocapsa sp. S129]
MNGQYPILVTGAAGLVGRAVLRRLTALKQAFVAIDRIAVHVDGALVAAADLTDGHRLHALVRRQPLAGIIHCGAISGPMLGKDNPFSIVETNIVGTANLLEIARIHAIPRFVFCSSCSVYGSPGNVPITEHAPLRPTSVYGASKVAGEQLVAAYSAEHRLDGVSLRLSWVYGPERTTDCLLRDMVRAAIAERPFSRPWGKGFPRQYIHADDAAVALVAALGTSSLPRTEYAITGDRVDTLDEVAELVRSVFPKSIISLGSGVDPLDDLQGRIDIRAARRDLGFAPVVDLRDGIQGLAERLSSAPP